jgi:hypothetical protein
LRWVSIFITTLFFLVLHSQPFDRKMHFINSPTFYFQYVCWLSGNKHKLEYPFGAIAGGDVIDCGILLNSKMNWPSSSIGMEFSWWVLKLQRCVQKKVDFLIVQSWDHINHTRWKFHVDIAYFNQIELY